MEAFLLSAGVIFLAELGDKSQLMAMAFAARYRFWPVMIGITGATLIVHAGSVFIGRVAAAALPVDAINIAAGAAYLGFAVWTLRGDELGDGHAIERFSGTAVRRYSTMSSSGEPGGKPYSSLSVQHGTRWSYRWRSTPL